MEKERKDNSFIKKPIYPGGQQALKMFIRKNLKYPEAALKEKKEGRVKLRMDIDHKGKVTKVKVISGLGFGCDEEATRLVRLLKFKIPKNPRKLKVIFHKEMVIHFNLPKKKTPQHSTQIKYQIKKENGPTKPKDSGGYNYTIEI